MSSIISHENLLKLVKRLDADYSPFGKVDRYNLDFAPDCSCGCKFFLPIEGQLGMDWGVCVNEKSHRCGLLTFEHQGCQFCEGEV